MYSFSRSPALWKRFFSVSKNLDSVAKESVKTTVDTGKQLEERVARMLKKRGHINIKMNQRVKDRNGNLSEFDIVYGWPFRHYVECKNYSHPVKLEMVAKFKVVFVFSIDGRRFYDFTGSQSLVVFLLQRRLIPLVQQRLV